VRRYKVNPSSGFDDTIVIDNIPIVDTSRKQKLLDRLRAAFDKVGAGIDESGVFMPWDEQGEGQGGSNKGYVGLQNNPQRPYESHDKSRILTSCHPPCTITIQSDTSSSPTHQRLKQNTRSEHSIRHCLVKTVSVPTGLATLSDSEVRTFTLPTSLLTRTRVTRRKVSKRGCVFGLGNEVVVSKQFADLGAVHAMLRMSRNT
jgi:hypothetical protein